MRDGRVQVFEVLQWLLRHDCPWNRERVMLYASRYYGELQKLLKKRKD